ncbi:pp2a regulatory subunit tap46 [Phtheirospermum japonicum]|uniref:PP2A regulatory subunit TAP46 n=1 Tax=Phtheirospermum japonicum TaxID=374723 RepID=A0A830DKN5_9LAMI|nr:pp2a regulatory subunit tap46 [Phtheirospermum japonicum]
MVELNMEEMSLPLLFEQSRKIHQAASDSSVDQDTVRKGCELLKICEEMIGKLGLFSANETKDDISTTKLKYLLVPYYLGELTEKITEEDRIQVLKASQAKLKVLVSCKIMYKDYILVASLEFLSFCEVMELIPKEELESSQAMGNTFADQRAKKIARFKRQKAAESKLLEIRERKERRGRSTRASALSTPVEAGEEDMDDDDGEEEREAWLTTISLALCKAFDLLDMLRKEEEMLSAIKERQSQGEDDELSHSALDERTKKAEAWHRNGAARARYTKPAAPITCATFAQDVLEGRANVSQFHEHKHQPMIFGPASLVAKNPTSEREKLAAQVFQPHHRLPTMSIEEAGLKEMEIMNKWQETNVRLMEEANSSWHKDNRLPSRPGENDDDDEEDDDAAQDKARAWDDWKDDNPRGAGNKKLTPCG